MADAVTSTTIFNQARGIKLVMKFTNISDGTGESGVIKVDKSTFTGPGLGEPGSLVIERIDYSTFGMAVKITCDRTSDIVLAVVQGFGTLDYTKAGGLQTNTAGDTGDIQFTTVGHTSGDTYDITLWMRKKF